MHRLIEVRGGIYFSVKRSRVARARGIFSYLLVLVYVCPSVCLSVCQTIFHNLYPSTVLGGVLSNCTHVLAKRLATWIMLFFTIWLFFNCSQICGIFQILVSYRVNLKWVDCTCIE